MFNQSISKDVKILEHLAQLSSEHRIRSWLQKKAQLGMEGLRTKILLQKSNC